MIEAEAKPTGKQFSPNKLSMIPLILVVMIAIGGYGYNVFRATRATSPQLGTIPITQRTLEEDYGLRIQLVAVTAAGGLVDVRLKIVDAGKAKAFLSDLANFPALRVNDGLVLHASQDVLNQDIQYENDRSIFILFPNAGSFVQPGDSVNIIFGNFQLEPIQSK